jgi:hypothetical protein
MTGGSPVDTFFLDDPEIQGLDFVLPQDIVVSEEACPVAGSTRTARQPGSRRSREGVKDAV